MAITDYAYLYIPEQVSENPYFHDLYLIGLWILGKLLWAVIYFFSLLPRNISVILTLLLLYGLYKLIMYAIEVS